MDLYSSFLRPGVVVEVVDSEGTIKATSPGLFSVEDDHELLPPIIPFCQGNGSSFSLPVVGENVWILHDKKNTQLFFYIRYHNVDDNVKKFLKDNKDEHIEVIFSRDTTKGVYQILFSDGSGLKFLKDGNYILISPEGNIDIVTENSKRSISISGDSICLGAPSKNASNISTHVAYGERVEDCLNTIASILKQIQEIAVSNPYTSSLSPAFTLIPKLESQILKVTSNDVKTV